MQHTNLPDSDTTCRTGDGGYLFGREFFPFHSESMRQHRPAKLPNFEHSRPMSGYPTNRAVLTVSKPISTVLENLLPCEHNLALCKTHDSGTEAVGRFCASVKTLSMNEPETQRFNEAYRKFEAGNRTEALEELRSLARSLG